MRNDIGKTNKGVGVLTDKKKTLLIKIFKINISLRIPGLLCRHLDVNTLYQTNKLDLGVTNIVLSFTIAVCRQYGKQRMVLLYVYFDLVYDAPSYT